MQQPGIDPDDILQRVFESINHQLRTRGNLGKITEIINQYDATDPPGGPFDINMGYDGLDSATLLQLAICHGQLEYLNWLIENGAKPWRVNEHRETALHVAITEEILPDEVSTKINKGTLNRAVAIVSILLQHNENRAPSAVYDGARPVWAKRNRWGLSPLDYAAKMGGAEVLKLFISKGAVFNGPMFTTQYGEIPDELTGTLTGLPGTTPPRADSMFTRFGNSLLHQSIQYGNHDAFDILMQDGANTSVYDAKGETPLTCAIVYGNWKAVHALVASGAVDVLQQHGRVFEYLAPVGSGDQFVPHQAPQYQFDGLTVRHCLASCHSYTEDPVVLDILALLVNAGADVRAKTSDGYTAFDLCNQTCFQSLPMALEIKRLERVTPWSAAFKKLRKDSVIMSLKHDSIKKSLFRTLPDELMRWFLDDMDNHDVAGTTVGPVT
ncbi:ankyrin repeat-containing domain protein [Baffinella frigidus]|nr:ankyrin repeat-containing domain protein [Cryptophyta sp. CCMP2293]